MWILDTSYHLQTRISLSCTIAPTYISPYGKKWSPWSRLQPCKTWIVLHWFEVHSKGQFWILSPIKVHIAQLECLPKWQFNPNNHFVLLFCSPINPNIPNWRFRQFSYLMNWLYLGAVRYEVITNFWSIVLDDHRSKNIYEFYMIVW